MADSTYFYASAWLFFTLSFFFERDQGMMKAVYRALAFVWLAVALVSCGPSSPLADVSRTQSGGERPPPRFVDAVLQPYVTEFVALATARGVPPRDDVLTVRIDDATLAADGPEPGTVVAGMCRWHVDYDGKVWRTVHVRSDMAPEETRKVVFHELTHCYYGVGHWGEPGDLQYWLVTGSSRTEAEILDRHFLVLRALLGVGGEAP